MSKFVKLVFFKGTPSNDLDMNSERRLASPFDPNGTGDQGAVMSLLLLLGVFVIFCIFLIGFRIFKITIVVFSIWLQNLCILNNSLNFAT